MWGIQLCNSSHTSSGCEWILICRNSYLEEKTNICGVLESWQLAWNGFRGLKSPCFHELHADQKQWQSPQLLHGFNPKLSEPHTFTCYNPPLKTNSRKEKRNMTRSLHFSPLFLPVNIMQVYCLEYVLKIINKMIQLLSIHLSGSPRGGSSARVTVAHRLHGMYPFPLLWIVPILLHKILPRLQLLQLHCKRQ